MPTFQHGKNGFLAIGYENVNGRTAVTTLTSQVTGATAVIACAPATGTLLAGGQPTLSGGTVYGAFVNGIPYATATKFANGTTSYTTLVNTSISGTASGAPVLPMVNISQYLNDLSLPIAIEPSETTTFSQAGVKTYIVGLKGYTISFSGMYDPTASTQVSNASTTGGLDAIMTDLIAWQDNANTINGVYTPNFVSFIYGPSTPGAFTGQAAAPQYYGQGIITKYDLKTSVSGVVTFDSEIQVTGAVTRTTL